MVETRRDTSVRRQQIVIAARGLIVKYGSEHVTVRRIAREIGVSEGAIYRHFKSKKDILSLLVDEIENALLSDIGVIPKDSPFTPETLERMMTNHMSRVVQKRGVSFQVIAEIISLGDKRLNKKVYDVINRYTYRIRDILSEGVKVGVVRPDADLEAMANLFFGMTQGIVNTWALSDYSFDLKEKYASLWRVFRKCVIKH